MTIQGFHAHVYFDASTHKQARALCEKAKNLFPLDMGRVHEKPVGPHPMWSCQIAFKPDVFGEIIPWLALNRDGLTVFIHPETGDVVKDHTEHAIWMGEMLDLDLSALT
ncbi:MAG: DOPA 4,5-dioxygenase family protein [Rhizobiaceae bacterium]